MFAAILPEQDLPEQNLGHEASQDCKYLNLEVEMC